MIEFKIRLDAYKTDLEPLGEEWSELKQLYKKRVISDFNFKWYKYKINGQEFETCSQEFESAFEQHQMWEKLRG